MKIIAVVNNKGGVGKTTKQVDFLLNTFPSCKKRKSIGS